MKSVEIFKHGSVAINRRGANLLLNSIWHAVLAKQSDILNTDLLMLFSNLDRAGMKFYISKAS